MRGPVREVHRFQAEGWAWRSLKRTHYINLNIAPLVYSTSHSSHCLAAVVASWRANSRSIFCARTCKTELFQLQISKRFGGVGVYRLPHARGPRMAGN